MAQDEAQFAIHAPKNPALMPSTPTVETPDTIKDIKPDKSNPNKIGAYFAGSNYASNVMAAASIASMVCAMSSSVSARHG